MKTGERRAEIVKMLRSADQPIAAKDLAARFQVSRQVIVQDMAVIRASIPEIISTNRGYVIQKDEVCSREFKVCHGQDRVEEELNIFVDYGGIVRNVSISHRAYGRITAEMDIRSRQDVCEFIARLGNSKSTLLGNATSGYHYHVIEAASQQRLDLIEEKLEEAGLLVPLLPWELEQKPQ